jgi:hypothetical protein
MNDDRYNIIKNRLSLFSIKEIQRIKNNIDLVCFDTLNYDKDTMTFCPLAIALDLHNTIQNPTDQKIKNEIAKLFDPVNALKGVKGIFYTKNRKQDLLDLCNEIIKEKLYESIN